MANDTSTVRAGVGELAAALSPERARGSAPGPFASAAGAAVSAQPTASGHAIHVRNLDAHYGSRQVLKSVDVSFAANQITAVVGPAGAGKSTLLRCINRMHEEVPGARVSGTITLGDLDLHGGGVDVASVRRAIGMVFTAPSPFPTMSIAGNVSAGLRLTGVRGRGAAERVERALTAVGLWDDVSGRLGSPGVGLSVSQQQQLCIARAIAVEPAVLLMDAPWSVLDPAARLSVEGLIADLRSHSTIVVATDDTAWAARVADSTVFMSDGTIDKGAAKS